MKVMNEDIWMDCDIISDLLPLYCDDVCSEISRKIVEEHLASCQQCSLLLKQMKTEYTISNKQEQSEETIVKDMASIWKKSILRSFIKGLFTALCICLFLFCSYWGLTRWAVIDISSGNVVMKVESEADVFEIYMEVMDGKKVYNVKQLLTEDGKLYMVARRGAVPVKNGIGDNWSGVFKIPKVSGTDKENQVEVKEIYYGSGSHSVLIWPQN